MSSGQKNLGYFPMTLIVGVACLSMISIFGFLSKYASENYLLMAAIFLVLFAPWLLASLSKGVDLAEPVFLYSLMNLMLFVGSGVWYFTDPPGVLANVNLSLDDPAITQALLYVFFSQLGFMMGYGFIKMFFRLVSNRQTFIPGIAFDIPPSIFRILVLLYSFSILFRIFLFSQGWKGSVTTEGAIEAPVGAFSAFVYIANIWVLYYGAFALLAVRSERLAKLFWFVLTPLEFVMLFASGDRRDLLVLILVNLVIYWYKNKNLPIKKLLILGIPVLGIFLPISTLYGEAMSELSHQGVKLDSVDTFVLLLSTGWDSSDRAADYISLMFTPVLRQFAAIVPTSIAVKYFDDSSAWLYGGYYFEALKSFVPSVLFADKHVTMQNMLDLFGSQFLVIPFYPTPVAPLFWAEAIWNFGFIGLVVLSVAAGCFSYGIYWLLMKRLTGFFPRWFYICNIIYASYGICGGVSGEYLLYIRNVVYFFSLYLLLSILRYSVNRYQSKNPAGECSA